MHIRTRNLFNKDRAFGATGGARPPKEDEEREAGDATHGDADDCAEG